MKDTKLVVIGAVIAIAGILVGYGLSSKNAGKQIAQKLNEPIKLGFIGPLSGDAVSYGAPMKNAVALAVDEINNAGGIYGKSIEMIYEDGKCKGKDAANSASKLIHADNVKFIIGGICSSETLGAAPIAEENKVILFSTGSGSPAVTSAGDYVFRNFPSDASSGTKIAEFAVYNNFHKVAVLAEETDAAKGIQEVFKKRFLELGGDLVGDESFKSESRDLRTQITKIKSVSPDAVFLLPQTPATAAIGLRQFKELGITFQILSHEMVNSDLARSLAEGVVYAEANFDEKTPLAQAYFKAYKEKYGNLDSSLPPVYLTTSYDAVYIFKELLEKYGEDSEKIKQGLYGIKNRQGAAGVLTIDENGDAVLEYVVKTIKDGKAVDVDL